MARWERVQRRVAAEPWNPEGLGNHRMVFRVDEAPSQVIACLVWRRSDLEPSRIEMRLFHVETGTEITDVHWASASEWLGVISFTAQLAGEYHAYYLPFDTTGHWFFPVVTYREPTFPRTFEPDCRTEAEREQPVCIPGKPILESRTEFDAFTDMEQAADREERDHLAYHFKDRAFLLFGEPRENAIRMRHVIPASWVTPDREPDTPMHVDARPGEWLPFQIGVYALRDLSRIDVSWTAFTGPAGTLAHGDVTCLNTGGTDWLGRPLSKDLSLSSERVQPLWFGLDLPEDVCGEYTGTVTVRAEGDKASLPVTVRVAGEPLPDRGDGDLWRLARLRWLNSTIGIDEEPTEGFLPIEIDGSVLSILGRTMELANTGLPARISTCFAPGVDRFTGEPAAILAAPVSFHCATSGAESRWTPDELRIAQPGPGTAQWETRARSGPLALDVMGRLEFDGHSLFELTVTADETCDVDDMRLTIPLREEIARYMMGFGREGGACPSGWHYRWDERYANHNVWIGDVHAGLQLKLRHAEDRWDLYDLADAGLPDSWHNSGSGGASVQAREGGVVELSAYSGPRTMRAGESISFRFSLLITPVKLLAVKDHWSQRYYHKWHGSDLDEAAGKGATIVNIHQGNALNPHINYPFRTADSLRRCVSEARERGLQVKLYYTVRELSNFTEELWALRSLGHEVFLPGGQPTAVDSYPDDQGRPPTGGPWLCEHLVEDYVPAWHQKLEDGHIDSAIATQGLSRWHNYYLEGLGWLVREVGIAGVYLDGIGYDRNVMKRMRKVLDRARPGCLLDFHSGNNFGDDFGKNNPACQYMEHFPYLDSLWLGEMFDYDKGPDYWLVEVSGIPFGLMGEMLQGGGNPWRGMVYGMTDRLGWCGDPSPIWKLWDEFGIAEARMLGYWHPEAPVKTDDENVLVTAYLSADRALLSVASWAGMDTTCRLSVDWDRLGFGPEGTTLHCPEIAGLQSSAELELDEPISVATGEGCLIILEQRGRE